MICNACQKDRDRVRLFQPTKPFGRRLYICAYCWNKREEIFPPQIIEYKRPKLQTFKLPEQYRHSKTAKKPTFANAELESPKRRRKRMQRMRKRKRDKLKKSEEKTQYKPKIESLIDGKWIENNS